MLYFDTTYLFREPYSGTLTESGERLWIIRHCPLNSFSSAMCRGISGVIVKTGDIVTDWLISWPFLADYDRFCMDRPPGGPANG